MELIFHLELELQRNIPYKVSTKNFDFCCWIFYGMLKDLQILRKYFGKEFLLENSPVKENQMN